MRDETREVPSFPTEPAKRSAADELKGLIAQRKAVESEISCCATYLANEARWQRELAREEQRLKWQQERVDRLRARRGKAGEENLARWHARLEQLVNQIVKVRNRAEIEKLLELQAKLRLLNEEPEESPIAMAACDSESEPDEDEDEDEEDDDDA